MVKVKKVKTTPKPKPTKKAVHKKPVAKKKPDIDLNQPIMFSPVPPKPAAIPDDY